MLICVGFLSYSLSLLINLVICKTLLGVLLTRTPSIFQIAFGISHGVDSRDVVLEMVNTFSKQIDPVYQFSYLLFLPLSPCLFKELDHLILDFFPFFNEFFSFSNSSGSTLMLMLIMFCSSLT